MKQRLLESQLQLFFQSRRVPYDLQKYIMQGVFKDARNIKRELVFGLLGLVSSVLLLLVSLSLFRQALALSGTSYFVSLLFTDFQSIIGSWNDFLYSFLESLPVWQTVPVPVSLIGMILTTKKILGVLKNNLFVTEGNSLWT